ncbi:acyl-CoA thioesterase [Psittacicella gerlachiana]|uniref:Thioesterase n=1 Tax=Psittacicella gerlachiana TaxID=2028574 RepID=A0A3A1YLD7_9GAMM|nr:acyl-CoA thioesterase [Psittacicella gerlachiana]RIY36827.1 thioesterase [Psittacicella gerlachiana]
MSKSNKHIYATHSSEYQIQFFDVDSMEIMWHGNYVKYLEMARCAFLEEIAYSYDVMKDKGYAWPIVQLNLKYVQPCLFKQKIKIIVNVVEYESCLRLEYLIVDAQTNKRLTKASTTQAAVDLQTGELQFQTPSSFCQALEAYPGFTPIS